MPVKKYILGDNLPVSVSKRKSNRSLRLSIAPNGEVRVTIPSWAPYTAGLAFAQSKLEWIIQNRSLSIVLRNGQSIGKAHRLILINKPGIARPTSRLKPGEVVVSYPTGNDPSDTVIQQLASKASIRALRAEAENLLPQRLSILAIKHGFEYRQVSIRQLKGRWGSCDQDKNITLNLFLMQLPWQDIDYVLLHELAHTKALQHGKQFWDILESVMPEAKQVRKRLKAYQPVLNGSSDAAVT